MNKREIMALIARAAKQAAHDEVRFLPCLVGELHAAALFDGDKDCRRLADTLIKDLAPYLADAFREAA